MLWEAHALSVHPLPFPAPEHSSQRRQRTRASCAGDKGVRSAEGRGRPAASLAAGPLALGPKLLPAAEPRSQGTRIPQAREAASSILSSAQPLTCKASHLRAQSSSSHSTLSRSSGNAHSLPSRRLRKQGPPPHPHPRTGAQAKGANRGRAGAILLALLTWLTSVSQSSAPAAPLQR